MFFDLSFVFLIFLSAPYLKFIGPESLGAAEVFFKWLSLNVDNVVALIRGDLA